MKEKDAISKGPKRRDETCLQTMQTITIPAGTILRSDGTGKYSAAVGLGAPGSKAQFIIDCPAGTVPPAGIKKVVG